MTTSWQDMVGRNANGASAKPEPATTAGPVEDEGAAPQDDSLAPLPDPGEYRPFLLQRGRTSPALFLDLRVFDPRAGTLRGSMMSYPQLAAIDYFDDHTIELNFGFRRFRIEGDGLSELVQRLQAGSVLAIQQYSERIWKARPSGALVRAIVETTQQMVSEPDVRPPLAAQRR